MDRRSFLRGISKPALALAAVPVVVSAADRAQDAGTAAMKGLRDQIAGMQKHCSLLSERLGRMEKRQKQMLRIVLAAAALTVGVDISILM